MREDIYEPHLKMKILKYFILLQITFSGLHRKENVGIKERISLKYLLQRAKSHRISSNADAF